MAGQVVPGMVENIKVNPCNAYWGLEAIQSFTALADVDDSLDGKFFDIEAPLAPPYTKKKYRVWFNTSGGSATAPAAAGRTLVEVALTTGDDATEVATAIKTALNLLEYEDESLVFTVDSAAAVVTVTCNKIGAVDVAANGAGGDSPAFTGYAISQEGEGGDLGLLSGDIELSPEEEVADIQAHQTGTRKIDGIRTGNSLEITLALMETTIDRVRALVMKSGGAFTPTDGTEVFGLGRSKQFTSQLAQARKLWLHPLAKEADDLSEDIAFWKAYPKIDSIVMSGENPQMINVTFRIFPDYTKRFEVDTYCIGDHTQDLALDAEGTSSELEEEA